MSTAPSWHVNVNASQGEYRQPPSPRPASGTCCWFLTSVTAPFSRQSTVTGGTVAAWRKGVAPTNLEWRQRKRLYGRVSAEARSAAQNWR